jgi:fumarylpyruvate hydrolase
VRRILCVGRNYAAHAREMGADERDPPFFFAKPADAVALGDKVPYPVATHDLHHEIELVVALKSGGSQHRRRGGDGPCLRLRGRRRPDPARPAGRRQGQEPSLGRGQGLRRQRPDRRHRPGRPARPDGAITLAVNGQPRQSGQIADMIWTIPEIIAEASKLWTLAAGDLIFTGTPEGVAAIGRGDRVEGAVEGVGRAGLHPGLRRRP